MVSRQYLGSLQGGMNKSLCKIMENSVSIHKVFTEYSHNILAALRCCLGKNQVVWHSGSSEAAIGQKTACSPIVFNK